MNPSKTTPRKQGREALIVAYDSLAGLRSTRGSAGSAVLPRKRRHIWARGGRRHARGGGISSGDGKVRGKKKLQKKRGLFPLSDGPMCNLFVQTMSTVARLGLNRLTLSR